jgi:CBS domain-containing protein
MRVKGFMTSAEKLITVKPDDTIQKAINLMMEHKVSSVVVLTPAENEEMIIPMGIVTKTDLISAYQQNISPIHNEVQEIMTKAEDLVHCHPNQDRDEAARILERSKNHHALVMEPTTNQFLGIVSSWDITAECARDDRAWPWNRSEDGRFHPPTEITTPASTATAPTTTTTTELPLPPTTTSPKSAVYHPTNGGDPKVGDSFRDYVDNLGFFD